MTTSARPGEGVIRITTRVCGNANNWQNVAAANNIRPPVYLVLLGQLLVVNCVGGSSAPAPQPAAVATSGWVRPVSACVSSGFGWRWGRMHNGVDLAAGFGVAIRAAASGTLSVGYQGSGAGNYSMIVHGNGLATVYMHQSRFAVTSGHVNAGQIIGYVGATGNAHGPHLHFEVHTRGLWNGRVDPASFMAARGVGFSRC
jgi:murein DD-endopeptidase MepM/ murein hydrolase activator NlpD